MRSLVVPSFRCILAACCLAGALALAGTTAASGNPQVGGTWMAGPGCGARHEWLQHPAQFPYFCDGAAYVEKARWRHWGAAKAEASATMNEAVLTSHNSVGTAPRSLSPVTIVASHVERCGARRVYKSVVIRFDNPRKGYPKTLKLPSYLVCPKPPVPHPSPSAAEFRARPGGDFVACAMYAGSRAQIAGVRCQGNPRAAEGEDPLVQVAKLQADGQVSSCTRLEAVGDDRCELGNVGDPIPTYSPGKRVRVGAFICAVLETGVECTVAATGKGFLITPSAVTPVGA